MNMFARWLHRQRCAICGQYMGKSGRSLIALETATGTGATWHLCEDCYVAVTRELERAELRTPARVRIAVGVVASERGQSARYSIWDERFWEQLSDRSQDRLLIWIFAIAFVVHAIAFMLVAAYVAIVH
ncbi:MAG TPA: hypothetical protein VKQ30_15225 [Ktedonobacterales bacterium]|nr:hypothetical protein [Ktedonobacterales bacterium]